MELAKAIVYPLLEPAEKQMTASFTHGPKGHHEVDIVLAAYR